MLERHAHNVPALKAGIAFAGEYIPVSSADEVRLACMLVCAYHNSLVRENIGDSSYGPLSPEDDSRQEECGGLGTEETNPTAHAPRNEDWAVVSKTRRGKGSSRSQLRKDVKDSLSDGLSEWDAEAMGEQVVYDATFEMNADLVPWRMERRDDWAIERYGYYI